jgi:hypothetical protein
LGIQKRRKKQQINKATYFYSHFLIILDFSQKNLKTAGLKTTSKQRLRKATIKGAGIKQTGPIG